MQIYGSMFDSLISSLNVLSANHNVIAGNVANVDTPGYRAKEMKFKEAFTAVLTKSRMNMAQKDERHLAGSAMQSSPYSFVSDQINNAMRNDGNNVNIDKEMVALSQNGLQFEVVSQMLSNKFNLLKYAISEGRRS